MAQQKPKGASLRNRLRRQVGSRMTTVPPKETKTYRVLVGGFPFWPGLVRGAVAVIVIGTLIGAQISPPESASTAVEQAVQTLAIAVIAFYFGTRTTLRPKDAGREQREPESR